MGNKKAAGVVYSTNPDFNYTTDDQPAEETLPKDKQPLRICLDKRNRKGKSVTLITGFVGDEETCEELAKMLKVKCGSGGSCRDNEILIQGDFRTKVLEILQKEGYAKSKCI